jgi:hypothetical protein
VGSTNVYSSQPYAELGYSMAASKETEELLVLGAPGYVRSAGDHRQGCVFVVFGALSFPDDVAVEAVADQVLCEEESDSPYSRFGQSVALADVTGDGIEDLIVGAAATGKQRINAVAYVRYLYNRL